MLPAARVVDAGAPPDAGGAVEVEETPRPVARRVLDHEVPVEQDALALREQRVVAVDVVPARLDHPDAVVGEVRDGALEELLGRREVCVEDGDELALRYQHPRLERPSLEAGAVSPVDVDDVDAARRPLGDGLARNLDGVVGRVVEDLNLETVTRVPDAAHVVDEPAGDVALVEDGQLDGDVGLLARLGALGRSWLIPLVAVIEHGHVVAMSSVEAQASQRRKVSDQKRDFEGCHPRRGA